MARFQLRKDDGVWFVGGALDERTDFAPLLADPATPLTINMEGVTSVNSVGTRALMELFKGLSGRPFEVVELPVFMVEMMNVLPSLFGGKADAVRSLHAPYHCESCQVTTEIVIATDEVRLTPRGPQPPSRRCTQCHAQLKLKIDPDDYFLFVTYAA